jgi:CheY-like chemotaxis protein
MNEIVLILDDEENIRRGLGDYLQKKGYGVHKTKTIEEARRVIMCGKIDFAIVDLKIDFVSEYGGIFFINFLKKTQPKCKAIILSAYSPSEDIQKYLTVEIEGFIEKGGESNYIRAVYDKLIEISASQPLKKCFVIMPFSSTPSCNEGEWTAVFNELIKPAFEKTNAGYICTRSEGLIGNIIENILDDLNRADLVIADLTDRNPNVFYELGVRHTLRDQTILITQNLDHVPFDLRHYGVIQYSWKTKADKSEFNKKIREVLNLIGSDQTKASSPVRKYLNL